jgi:Trk K+ transport system NAD-binding subunit
LLFRVKKLVERTSTDSYLLCNFGDGGDVSDVTVDAPTVVGTTIAAFDLPGGCIIGLVEQDGERFAPTPDTVLERGDMVTLLGRVDMIAEARTRLEGDR